MTLLSDILGRLRKGQSPFSFPDLPTQPATVEKPKMTQDEFTRAAGLSLAQGARWFPFIEACLREFKIDTSKQKAAFIANVAHESAGFTKVVESLNYSVAGLLATFPTRVTRAQAEIMGRSESHSADQKAIAIQVYGNRLGNRAGTDDGWNFRGRGLIQITGRSNYKACGEVIKIDFENQPEKLSEDKYAALSAGWFWSVNNLNGLAEQGDFRQIVLKINGGLNGYDDRLARYKKAIGVLNGTAKTS